MSRISLTPQNFGTLYDTIADIGAFVCEMTTADALTKTFINQLEGEKGISGFFVLQKDGASDVFMTIIDASSFSITRTVNVNVKVGVF